MKMEVVEVLGKFKLKLAANNVMSQIRDISKKKKKGGFSRSTV